MTLDTLTVSTSPEYLDLLGDLRDDPRRVPWSGTLTDGRTQHQGREIRVRLVTRDSCSYWIAYSDGHQIRGRYATRCQAETAARRGRNHRARGLPAKVVAAIVEALEALEEGEPPYLVGRRFRLTSVAVRSLAKSRGVEVARAGAA